MKTTHDNNYLHKITSHVAWFLLLISFAILIVNCNGNTDSHHSDDAKSSNYITSARQNDPNNFTRMDPSQAALLEFNVYYDIYIRGKTESCNLDVPSFGVISVVDSNLQELSYSFDRGAIYFCSENHYSNTLWAFRSFEDHVDSFITKRQNTYNESALADSISFDEWLELYNIWNSQFYYFWHISENYLNGSLDESDDLESLVTGIESNWGLKIIARTLDDVTLKYNYNPDTGILFYELYYGDLKFNQDYPRLTLVDGSSASMVQFEGTIYY